MGGLYDAGLLEEPWEGGAAGGGGIYCRAMDATGPTLLRRALAVLQAKQYLVFYAIPVYALAAVVPLVLSWLHDGGSAEDVLARVQAPLYDVVAAPGLIAVGVLLVYLVAYTWFRAAYIRSIVGRFHLRPQDERQFASLLGFHVLIEIVSGAGAWVIVATDNDALTTATGIVVFVFSIAVMYADYAIVITGLDPARAIARSWACVGSNLALSALLALVVSLIAMLASAFLAETVNDGLLQALPLLVIYIVVMGVVTFIADVVLVVTYMHAVETGRLPRAR
jgi:hypothetical protein